jgi:hypothetical protein
MVTRNELHPYASLVLASTPAPTEGLVDAILAQALEVLAIANDDQQESDRRLLSIEQEADEDGLAVGWFIYVDRRPPTWVTPTVELRDETNHLLLVARTGNLLALCGSESGAGRRLARRFERDNETLGKLRRIPSGTLNAAFARGAPKTLWLSGVHRSTPTKADSKILAGTDLRAALSPLGDQSYTFSAARADSAIAGLPGDRGHQVVGYSPRGSRLWIGPTRDWTTFRNYLAAVLAHLQGAMAGDPVDMPLPVLAIQLTGSVELDSAYDLSLISPDVLAGNDFDDEDLQRVAERWTYQANFEITVTDGDDFQALLLFDGQAIGRLDFDVTVGDDGRVTWQATAADQPADPEHAALLREAAAVCRDARWVTIYYESGHTVADGVVFSVRHRDVRFEGWRFDPLAGIEVNKEKPGQGSTLDVDAIGADDGKSLFDWVARSWPLDGDRPDKAWLASDDGSMEIADFVYVDPTTTPPALQLIHVKGSGSDRSNREVSTSDYEVVVGQAVKNLRHLDQTNLADALQDGAHHAIASATWQGHSRVGARDSMINTLRALGPNYRREVYIVQPRVTSSELSRCHSEHDTFLAEPDNASTLTSRVRRIRQLDTLLLGAEADCHELGATLTVLSQQTEASHH